MTRNILWATHTLPTRRGFQYWDANKLNAPPCTKTKFTLSLREFSVYAYDVLCDVCVVEDVSNRHDADADSRMVHRFMDTIIGHPAVTR